MTSRGRAAAGVNVALYRTGPDGVGAVVDYAVPPTPPGSSPSWTRSAVVRPTWRRPTSTRTGASAVRPLSWSTWRSLAVRADVVLRADAAVAGRGAARRPDHAAGSDRTGGPTAPLTVEQRFGAGAWQPLGTVPVAADGTFTLPLGPRSQVGTWTVRATHPAEGALVAGVGRGHDEGHRHRGRQEDRLAPDRGYQERPARWGTCRIGYRVNERRMPATGMADLREAMRRVTQVTGIRFRYRGKTSAVPQGSYGGPGLNKMVVAWAPPAKSGGLLVDGVGGVGGTSRTSSRLLSGYVLMNSDYSDKAEAGFGAGQPLGLVLMHELGHVVGLDHADRRTDHGARLAAAGRRVGRRRPQRPAPRRLPLPLIAGLGQRPRTGGRSRRRRARGPCAGARRCRGRDRARVHVVAPAGATPTTSRSGRRR